jgi:hypothetical protein
MVTQLRLGEIAVDVVLKDIKNVHLGVYPPTGRVRISAPKRMSLDTIRVFAISKLGWIKQQQKKLRGQERETPREVRAGVRCVFNVGFLDLLSRSSATSRAYVTFGRRPDLNGHVESFNGRLRDECLNASWFRNLADARTKISNWHQGYNRERPHSSLGYRTPNEFDENAAILSSTWMRNRGKSFSTHKQFTT